MYAGHDRHALAPVAKREMHTMCLAQQNFY